MNKKVFTPGPWQLGRTFGQQGLIGPENGYPVTSITGYYERSGQSEANAHLIAAAPDLYEALRLFMALDPAFTDATGAELDLIIAKGKSEARMAKAVKASRAALAKAVQP